MNKATEKYLLEFIDTFTKNNAPWILKELQTQMELRLFSENINPEQIDEYKEEIAIALATQLKELI